MAALSLGASPDKDTSVAATKIKNITIAGTFSSSAFVPAPNQLPLQMQL
jgi:hypothetical protein